MQWRFPFNLSRTKTPAAVNDECSEIEPLLSLYSDSMTSTAETRRVERHLAQCESCRKSYYWMRATYEVISHRPVVLPPPDMASRIRQAIAQADAVPAVPVRMRFNPRPAYALAASLTVLTAVVFAVNHALKSGGGHVEVAINTHSTTNPAPAVSPGVTAPVKPHEQSHQVASVSHPSPTKAKIHTPVAVAINTPEPVRSTGHEPIGQLNIDLPRSLPAESHAAAAHSPRTAVARVTPHSPTPAHPVVRNTPSPERVARVTPEQVEPAPQPVHITTPAPQPERVAVAPAPQPAPAPERVATVTPEPPVSVAVDTHPARGLNDDLREAVLTKWHPGTGSETSSFKVARIRAPHDDAFNIVGSAIN